MSVDSQMKLLELMKTKTHVSCYQKAGCHIVHKHHSVFHLSLSAELAGNLA